MKLSEIKVLEAQETHHGATVMLKGGWYLRRKLAGTNKNLSFSIHRLMEDGQFGECWIRGYDNAENQVVEFVWMPYAGEGADPLRYQARDKDEARDAFYKWLEIILHTRDEPIPEAMESADGMTVGLKGGYFLEFSSQINPNTNRYLIYRLMDEDVLGECSYTTNQWQDKSTFGMDINVNGDRHSQIYRAASLKQLKQAFIKWVEDTLLQVQIAEAQESSDEKTVMLKDGWYLELEKQPPEFASLSFSINRLMSDESFGHAWISDYDKATPEFGHVQFVLSFTAGAGPRGPIFARAATRDELRALFYTWVEGYLLAADLKEAVEADS